MYQNIKPKGKLHDPRLQMLNETLSNLKESLENLKEENEKLKTENYNLKMRVRENYKQEHPRECEMFDAFMGVNTNE